MPFSITHTALALAEGFGLAFSPCILPILPFILASSATKDRLRPFLVIAGFVITFTIFSLVSRSILSIFNIQQDAIQTGAYILLLIFGIVMVVPFLEERFSNVTSGIAGSANSLSNNKLTNTKLGGIFVGALIGLVWVPCAGPILASAILQVIQSQTNFEAVTTITAFSVGAGMPMLAIALFGQYLSAQLRFISKHAVTLRRIMGVSIIAFAFLALSGVSIAEWAVAKTSQTRTTEQNMAGLQDGLDTPYPTPEISGIKKWFNTDPLDLSALKGKVVLVDFWTYSCINCIRTLPYIESWYEKYKDKGLVIIGVHSPEFAFEGKEENVSKALKKFGLTYPVAMDNDFSTWRNFENRYWPAHYLIDKNGMVVYTHFGEGKYDVTENNIRYLLGLQIDENADAGKNVTAQGQTPETYLGNDRAERESKASPLPTDNWKVKGNWKRTGEYIESAKSGDFLMLHFRAKKVFLVMESATDETVNAQILMNGKALEKDTADTKSSIASVKESRLYEIIAEPSSTNRTVTIKAGSAGLRLYAFTFES
ncbi:MAG: cytochrome c biogenesis protein DipZ [Micavibrio aeruginosavorus]|uniref:Cytochrome c biogenesis protein DipZ n=1 Tax=Micavibrio aeruginosavorus TaxID=349221 RepID=A0A2W5N2V9_9BACT|nr:MAG: cytochrome c biogenesis protein DipZ [Micavibrio aeruginosavorus]